MTGQPNTARTHVAEAIELLEAAKPRQRRGRRSDWRPGALKIVVSDLKLLVAQGLSPDPMTLAEVTRIRGRLGGLVRRLPGESSTRAIAAARSLRRAEDELERGIRGGGK